MATQAGRGRSRIRTQSGFAAVPAPSVPRSAFDRSHGVKTTFDAGYLVPIYVDDVLPGDTHQVQAALFARLATPLWPVMDQMWLDTFWFFVPNRLVWDNWKYFMGEKDNPGDSTSYVIPTTDHGGSTIAALSLYDYMGLPTGKAGVEHSSLPLRAYNLIWNEWFRDANLQDSVVVDKDNGPDTVGDYVLLKRGKRKDYFYGALPWPQRGDAVELPLGEKAPIYGIGVLAASGWADTSSTVRETGASGNTTYAGGTYTSSASLGIIEEDPDNAGYPGIFADLSSATAATINEIRTAFQVQKLYERDARGGGRYTEILRSHFGVISPDMRLQRPELLATSTSPVNVVPVASTANFAGHEIGTLRGFGVSAGRAGSFTYSATEHGWIIGLVSCRADMHYQQGIQRMWSRQTRLDHYWPSLAHLGEQAVLNKEIYFNNDANDDLVWGYQERYAEYKYKPSLITGQFRSVHAQSLDPWHLAIEFSTLPLLNDAGIQENPPIDRVVVDVADPHFLFDGYFRVRSIRPMPAYSVPGLVDHF